MPPKKAIKGKGKKPVVKDRFLSEPLEYSSDSGDSSSDEEQPTYAKTMSASDRMAYVRSFKGKNIKGNGFKEDYLDKITGAVSSTWNKPATPKEKKQLRVVLDTQNAIAGNVPILNEVWQPVSSSLANKYGVGKRGKGAQTLFGSPELLSFI